MSAHIIDGKTIAQEVRAEWKVRADTLKARGITPGLAVIIVGEDAASKVYVGNKVKACAELGLYSQHIALPADTAEAALLKNIADLNADANLTTKHLPSGAGHDAQHMARLCPSGMIFVPSVGGISHAPKEFTKPHDIVNGANVLLQTILALDEMVWL